MSEPSVLRHLTAANSVRTKNGKAIPSSGASLDDVSDCLKRSGE